MLLLLSSFGSPVHADPSARITGVEYLGDLPTLVADRRGLFKQSGIDAAVSYTASGKRNLELLRSGETDFALMALTPLALDMLADPDPGEPDDPVILASLVHSTQLNRIVVRSGVGGAREPSALIGGRIGLVRGTNAEFVWWLFAEYHGFDPRSVSLVDLPVDELHGSLKNGDIDAAVLWEPWASRARFGDDAALQVLPGSNVYTAKWVITARRGYVDRHPELSRSVLAAYRAAVDYIDRHPVAAVRLYADQAGLDPDVLPGTLEDSIFELNLDWSLIATLQQQLAWARRAGYSAPDAGAPILPAIAAGPLRALSPGAVGFSAAFDSRRGMSP